MYIDKNYSSMFMAFSLLMLGTLGAVLSLSDVGHFTFVWRP